MTDVAMRGKLIAIEGVDGSGKGTQAAALVQRLQAEGISSVLISFPRYQATFFGARIGDFLNGRFGALDEVHPFLAASLFAGDRLESRDLLNEALAANQVVVLDRYVASNIAHQAAKRTGDERQTLTDWIETLEFSVNGLPKPDQVLLLDLPAVQAQTLIARKNARTYTDRAADLQEADAAYLEEVRSVYQDLARTNETWTLVPVSDASGIRPVDAVFQDLWNAVKT